MSTVSMSTSTSLEPENNDEKDLTVVDELGEENNEERRDQIIDALNVAAGWMADSPDEEDSFEGFLHDGLLKYRQQRIHAWNVLLNLKARMQAKHRRRSLTHLSECCLMFTVHTSRIELLNA